MAYVDTLDLVDGKDPFDGQIHCGRWCCILHPAICSTGLVRPTPKSVSSVEWSLNEAEVILLKVSGRRSCVAVTLPTMRVRTDLQRLHGPGLDSSRFEMSWPTGCR